MNRKNPRHMNDRIMAKLIAMPEPKPINLRPKYLPYIINIICKNWEMFK